MDETDSDQVPDRVRNRVRTDAHSFIGRDADLMENYQYSDELGHEPVKAIQKEIDGMARLLCALVADDEVSSNNHYLGVYQQETGKLRDLEQEVISQLPEREGSE